MLTLDDEFPETDAKNLNIARKLLNVITLSFLFVLACFMGIGMFQWRHPIVLMILPSAGMLTVLFLSPIGLVYSIRSIVKKEPGKNKKWLTLFGFIVFNLLVTLVIGFIASDILTKL